MAQRRGGPWTPTNRGLGAQNGALKGLEASGPEQKIPITLISIRIPIKMKTWIWIRIKMKTWIWIRI